MNGPRRGKTEGIQIQSINHDCQELLNLWRSQEARSVRFFCSFLDNTQLVGIEAAGFIQKKAQPLPPFLQLVDLIPFYFVTLWLPRNQVDFG